jgi:hypothetical protein
MKLRQNLGVKPNLSQSILYLLSPCYKLLLMINDLAPMIADEIGDIPQEIREAEGLSVILGRALRPAGPVGPGRSWNEGGDDAPGLRRGRLLRWRMIENATLAGLAPRRQDIYIKSVRRLAIHWALAG